MENLRYIIYASHFNENSGGQIVLHRLCDLINKNGKKAYIYPYYYKPKIELKKPLRSIFRIFRYIYWIIFKPLKMNPNFNTPKYNKKITKNCIVVYPEIIDGNILNASKVVRWFLHKPGFHTGNINYGNNELYFFYQKIFNDITINPNNNNLLRVIWNRFDIYKKTNYKKRKGICYMIRKGKYKEKVPQTKNAILLDNKSHKEIAYIMNQCEYFISYDTETLYSQYAVLCGCKSIVIPNNNTTKEQWQPKKEFRYGIAYGFSKEEIKEAESTKHLVYDVLKNEENNSNKSVNFFIQTCENYFK
jgi:hypothetical protein